MSHFSGGGINSARGLLREFGIVFAAGAAKVSDHIQFLIEHAEAVGNTRSTRCAAVSAIRLPPHDGHQTLVFVHKYLDIDRRRVYEVLTKDLGDFEKFIKAVSKLL